MSLKSCSTRLLPIVFNILKSDTKILKNQCMKFSYLSNNLPQKLIVNTRYLNTTTSASQKQENEIKQVYYGVLTPQIKAVKVFSLTSSIVGIIAQPFLYQEIASTGNIPIIVAAYSFIGFFTLVTPLLLNSITKKYITNLEYNEKDDSYIATTVNFFCISKKTEFKTDEVVVPDVPGMFTTFLVKNKALFLDPRLFDQPDHYAKIMGYDKPMDFKLYETPPDKTKDS